MRRVAAAMVGLGLAGAALAGTALAGAVPIERGVLGQSEVTLYRHPFLQDEELATLRLVMTNEAALAIFVPQDKAAAGGFAALAASPDDGFVREGKPVASAVALAGLADAAAAETAATDACNALRQGAAPCVMVLLVEPQQR
ncbi:MAG: hypothetical protein IAE87_06545 [Rhodobacteraceae bacterium]|nr:hypothetical protein [Paracoccaceae bacterium]